MKISTSHARSESGFTLVELLLAITLMAMLLSLAYGGLRAATRVTASGQVLLAESGNVRVTHQFIRRQLNQMLPLTFDFTEDINQQQVVFEGSIHRIQFVAPMPGYLGRGGPQVQYLEFVHRADGIDLLFNHQLLQAYDPMYTIEREPIVLLEGVEGAQFEFLSNDENGDPLAWATSWETPAVLPAAVRLNIDFTEDRISIWPLLMTAAKTSSTQANIGSQSVYSKVIGNLTPASQAEPR